MSKAGKTGVKTGTPQKILFGAGTYHKNLKYTGSAWNFEESIIGATKGGGSFTITPEFYLVEPDGALVKTKGMEVKVGESAKMDTTMLELTKDMIKASVIGKDGESQDNTYDLIESKANIEEGDYLENVAFVGKTLAGKNIIVIMDNALCTSGLSGNPQNKQDATYAYTFETHADLESDLDTLPYHIYYPKAVA